VITRPEASTDTEKWEAMPLRHPEGEEEANVAFTTSRTETTVMYQRRLADQFLGFSMSLGAKSNWPWEFKCGIDERPLLRYGFAVGRERRRSIRSMACMVSSSDDGGKGRSMYSRKVEEK